MTFAAGSSDPLCLALDVGGTKIEASVLSFDGEFLARERMATRSHEQNLFGDVAALLQRVGGSFGVGVVGVGCGGPMRGGGAAVSPLNIPAWRDFPLLDELTAVFNLPVFIDNDAKALALAEGHFGAAKGHFNYLSMVVSTGVGGGLVLNGNLVDGRDGNAGHIGHVMVEPEGRLCACGSRGCLEAEVSGAAIAQYTGASPALASRAVRQRCGEMVGRALSSAAALLDFDRCFIGGSVAFGFGDPFFEAARESVATHAHISHARSLLIEPSGLDTRGPLLGAACVGWRGLQNV